MQARIARRNREPSVPAITKSCSMAFSLLGFLSLSPAGGAAGELS
jgi:hypothetical protein